MSKSKFIGIRIGDELLDKINSLRGNIPLSKFIKDTIDKSITGKAEKVSSDTSEFLKSMKAINEKTDLIIKSVLSTDLKEVLLKLDKFQGIKGGSQTEVTVIKKLNEVEAYIAKILKRIAEESIKTSLYNVEIFKSLNAKDFNSISLKINEEAEKKTAKL